MAAVFDFDDVATFALLLLVDFDALALPLDFAAPALLLLAFDALALALLLLVVLCERALRALRTGRFQSTALSARKLAGITIGPSA